MSPGWWRSSGPCSPWPGPTARIPMHIRFFGGGRGAARAAADYLVGEPDSAAQSRKLERNPWGTAPMPSSRTIFEAPRLPQHRQRPGGQGKPMVPVRLHPLRRDPPVPRLKVHLLPPHPAYLTAPARRERQELEGGRGIGPRRAHLLHRPANLRIRQRRLMPGPDPDLGKCRADGVSCRVVFPVAVRDRPLHHGGYPLPHPAGGLPQGPPQCIANH